MYANSWYLIRRLTQPKQFLQELLKVLLGSWAIGIAGFLAAKVYSATNFVRVALRVALIFAVYAKKFDPNRNPRYIITNWSEVEKMQPHWRRTITMYVSEVEYQLIRRKAEMLDVSASKFTKQAVTTYIKPLEKHLENAETVAA